MTAWRSGKIYAKKFEDTKFEQHFGNDYRLLLPKEMTGSLELSLVKVKKGSLTPSHRHEEEEQAYIILKGKGIMRVNEEITKSVKFLGDIARKFKI